MRNTDVVLLFVWLSTFALADDEAFQTQLFAVANNRGGLVMIPPGDFQLAGETPITISSNTTVMASGPRIHLPERLGD